MRLYPESTTPLKYFKQGNELIIHALQENHYGTGMENTLQRKAAGEASRELCG